MHIPTKSDALVISKTPRPAVDAGRRDRLGRVARRDPAAVLGVLEYWLAPETGESEPRGDN